MTLTSPQADRTTAPRIRPATADDVPEIVRIYVESKTASTPRLIDDYDRDTPYLTARWDKYVRVGSTAQKATGDSFAFLAEDGGRRIAFAAYHHTTRHGT